MGTEDFWQLPLGIQAALGFGYLAYITAYTGMRRAHSAQDAIFISLAFGSVSFLTFAVFEHLGGPSALLLSLAAALATACLWRGVARNLWQRLILAVRVHRDDGLFHGWDAVVQTKGEVGQVSVHTKDGRVLYLNDRKQYRTAPWQGLYLGGDGSVTMIVEEEELPDGSTETRSGILHDEGARMTYIPASEVARVNIRIR
ncbi:hypothetical protein [Citreimonas sp.]|uniref:hypothetical protein n=1 Tax=Citreimonas sp. TaxID=3036715 RepID=UPI004058BC9E